MTKKYRQRGYQDDDDDRKIESQEKRERGPRRGYGPREPQKVNIPGFRDVLKCACCGSEISLPISIESQCANCNSDLHSCGQCTWFDTSNRFECEQPIPKRILPKDTRNSCKYFEIRVTVERETHSAGPINAKKNFEDLFK